MAKWTTEWGEWLREREALMDWYYDEDGELRCRPPKMDEILDDWRRPMPDGIYDVVVSKAWVWRDPDGDDVFIMDLTIRDPRYPSREFTYRAKLNDRDNNYCVRQALSALLHREVTNGDWVEIDDLFGRYARVRVQHDEAGERVLTIESHERRDKAPEFAREVTTDVTRDHEPYVDYIPLHDMGYGW